MDDGLTQLSVLGRVMTAGRHGFLVFGRAPLNVLGAIPPSPPYSSSPAATPGAQEPRHTP